MTDVPVLIVGGGPVGLALAGDLGWRGTPCLLIERSDGRVLQPRMDMVGVRTMEFARRWGIVDWVEQSPYPRDYPQDYVYVSSLTGLEFERERFPALKDAEYPPQSPQRRERCPQDMFDPILTRFVRTHSEVEVRYGTELLALTETPDHVEATVRSRATGQTEVITAKYVVGCDGGDSTVRELMNIERSGSPGLTYTTNVIFRCEDLSERHDKGKAYRFICIQPEGTYATIVAINGKDRWRLSMIGDDNPRRVSDADIDEAIVTAVGTEFPYEVLSVMHWVRSELIADQYGTNRVFLAGDAAHVMSPTGGFGMNSGIGDAVDLSWKLGAVLDGWGGPALLPSYEAERRPVAIRNAAEATANLRNMLDPREHPPKAEAFIPGPAGEAARAEFGQRYKSMMGREWFAIGIHLGYRYDASPVIADDPAPRPDNPVATYQQSTYPGGRAPHVWLADGSSTLDLFGRGFTLLRIGEQAPSGTSLKNSAARQRVPMSVVHLSEPDVVAAYVNQLVLVRPDGHVAWRGDDVPVDPDALIALVTGSDPVDGSAVDDALAESVGAEGHSS